MFKVYLNILLVKTLSWVNFEFLIVDTESKSILSLEVCLKLNWVKRVKSTKNNKS